ncbi:histidine phosphatase family protein [Sulfitobacter pontiacus]|uniref:histidine phosphatase family protein n=1 Tax=Sulfitobacter pontiacus TaxID=60137 RepID=UPI0015E04E3B|nr:histidine phosphatase family protein [Sulfitobacter pontiacus]QLL41985.1 histidine phosphatase family protein [Sulfitobacter pontiacus]
MIRLALLRHGHTGWNRAGRIQGRTDIPLDDDARAGLAALALPMPWNRADLVSSPLSRAAETARLVADRAPKTAPALMEMDWGKWEGLHGVDLKADPASGFRDIEDWGWGYTPPGGESPDSLRERLIPWANGLTRDTVAVCHIGVMRVLLAHATGWGFAGPAPFQIKRNRLYLLDISPKGWTAHPDPIRLEPRL